MNLLLELTVRGSLAALIVIVVDRSFAGSMTGSSRRWWWGFVPLAFLVPLRLPILPAPDRLPVMATAWKHALLQSPTGISAAAKAGAGPVVFVTLLWLVGAITYVAFVVIQTARASRRWSRERLSTNRALLELLEDCKAEAGVIAPIGLVVSRSVPSPAIMGWLRPRILLPASLVASAPLAEIRPILLHELAHFRWCDVPFSWLLTVMRAIHWFNPLAHLGATAWARFREEAADEAAMKWMRDDSGQAYGEALLRTLRLTRARRTPFGSLAAIESCQHLKRRIIMINRYPNKTPRILLAGVISLLLTVVVFSKMARAANTAPADPTVIITAAVQTWLGEIDGGRYAQSWKDASTLFRSRVSAEVWVELANKAETRLGKCTQRQKVSLTFKTSLNPKCPIKGEFANVQFDSSFENTKHAVETVSFHKEADGTWKAAGYLVHF